MSEIKAIILDGVGINLKTSIIDSLEDYGYTVLRSDSWFYNEDNRELFPFEFKYTERFKTRFMEISTAIATNPTEYPIIVDRGCFNQIIWGLLTYNEVVDNYMNDEEDRRLIARFTSKYHALETSIGVKRFLLDTDWDELLDASLNESNYDTDPHTQYRIDTFYDKQYYSFVRSAYNAIYKVYNPTDTVIPINNTGMPISEVPYTVNRIVNMIDACAKDLRFQS